ncbi:unnamed protein product [Lupinus luteus]|uniref:Uncharacterized protein n=1 Tax=Lupinus luteus TaxID=3873 RepID=A0AAV1YS81_LUPLU
MAPSRVPHFGGKSFEVEIRPLASKNPVCLPRKKDVRWCRVGFCILAYYRGLAACLPAHAPWWVRMARHGAPPQRPSRLSQACWCVFPWRSGQFDRVIFHAESWSYVAGWAGRSSQLSWRLLGR